VALKLAGFDAHLDRHDISRRDRLSRPAARGRWPKRSSSASASCPFNGSMLPRRIPVALKRLNCTAYKRQGATRRSTDVSDYVIVSTISFMAEGPGMWPRPPLKNAGRLAAVLRTAEPKAEALVGAA
jgi:hypothetical protein